MKKRRLREGSGVLSFSPWLMQRATRVSREHSRFASLKTWQVAIALGINFFFFFFTYSASADFIRNCWRGGRAMKSNQGTILSSLVWHELRDLLCLGIAVYAWAQNRPYRVTGKGLAAQHVLFSGKTSCLPGSPSLPPVCLSWSRNSSIKVKPTPNFTLGIKDKTKQAPKTWPTGTLQPSRLPRAGIKPVSQLALPVAKEWLKEPSSLFPRA